MASKQYLLWTVCMLGLFTLACASSARDRSAAALLRKKQATSVETISGRPNQVQCANGANKRHQDPKDETKFYMCTYSSAHRIWMVFSFNCPTETAFDTRAQKCARRETIEANKNPSLISHKTKTKSSNQVVVVNGKPRPANNMNYANLTRPRFPVRRNPVVATTRPMSLSQRVRDQVKINVNYSRTRPTTVRYTPTTTPSTTTTTITTTTTTTTEPPTTTTLEPVVRPLEIKSNLTGETPSSTKHISVIRSVASKIAYLAQKIETLLTSIESSLSSCDEEATANLNNAFVTKTPSDSLIDQFISAPSGHNSNEEDESPSKEFSSEDLSLDDSKENQPSIQLTTPSEESSEDPSAWSVFLNQLKPNLPNENSNPSSPQKSEENSGTDNFSDSQENPLKIQNVLENFFKTTNATTQSQFQVVHPVPEGSQNKILSNLMLAPLPEATSANSEEQPEITEGDIKTKGSHRRPRVSFQQQPLPFY